MGSVSETRAPGESVGRLDGKTALISGAAHGMGASHARAFVEHGARVVLGDLDVESAERLAAELGAASRAIRLDVRDSSDWDRAVACAVGTFGGLNVLVNNAGVHRGSSLRECSDEEWELVMSVNATGAFKGIRAAAGELARCGPSSVINISSTAGLKGFGEPAYTASKWALRGLTKSAAVSLADSGIRVNSVHPGNVSTRMIAGMYPDFEHVLQKRAGRPEEISELVVYLASDESSFSTGAEFVADGGETAGLPEV